MSNRIYLTDRDRVTKNENNLINLTLADGTEYKALEPRRLFPVSRLEQYITLLDSEGKEIAVIRNLSDLEENSKKVLISSLDDYYLVPNITRIISVTEKNGKIHWCVETDRGYKEFDIKNRNHDVRVFHDGKVRVRDSDDNRYIIPCYHDLDKASLRQIAADL